MTIRSSHGSWIGTPIRRALSVPLLVVMLSFATLACGGAAPGNAASGAAWEAETTVEGDVTTVRTVAGSVWGAPARIEETLSIGIDQGEEPYMFGRISGVAGSVIFLVLVAAPVAAQRPRARDLGVPFDGTPGPLNAITDVEGIEVGHTTLIRGSGPTVVGDGPVRTGVTAVWPRGNDTPDPAVADERPRHRLPE